MRGALIHRPIISEKMDRLQESQRKYAFVVSREANKLDIKKAIEEKFAVRVAKVATLNVRGKSKTMTVRSGGRTIRTQGRRSHWKKAIVTLEKGESINLYEVEPTA